MPDKQIFFVCTKSGEMFKVGDRVQTGMVGCWRTWTVPQITEKDDGWVTVHLERVPEECRPKMCWTESNSGMCLAPHTIAFKTDLMEITDGKEAH